MDPEEEAQKSSSGNLEALFNDRSVSGLPCSHLTSIQSDDPGDRLSFPSNPVTSHQVIMHTAAHGLPTRSMGKRKGEEDKAVSMSQNGPLNLLDLPPDILKEILSQVTSTSDLTALALTHSALHRLVIPIIYSRFSIVWPTDDGPPDSDAVDALTYGLATLVTGEDLFDRKQPYQKTAGWGYCQHCTCENCQEARVKSQKHPIKRVRRGNHFAQYTRSFCIGNGPKENVKEYHIKREGGKMLGTLAALAVARMPNLEKFKWDMPTGIVRDVWASLAYAINQLETVWVRFHDNRQATTTIRPPIHLPVNQTPLPTFGAMSQISLSHPSSGLRGGRAAQLEMSYGRIEHPSFSILPPLKRLNVLDIDELAYAEEISVLLEKSSKILRELRISIAPYFLKPGSWTVPSHIAEFFGGVDVTELIFSKLYDSSIREGSRTPSRYSSARRASDQAGLRGLPRLLDEVSSFAVASRSNADLGGRPHAGQIQSRAQGEHTARSIPTQEAMTTTKLRIHLLELERLPLNATALQNAIDWSSITELTLLHCGNHEQLWKALRRNYSPRLSSTVFRREFSQVSSDEVAEILSQSNLHSLRSNSWPEVPGYRLNLKKIHTDTVSPALIIFLKETLAPNSLEEMYLQDGRDYSSNVKLDAIFQGPVKRHRGSLSKVMIDSAIGMASKPSNQQRKKWMLNTESLAFFTSGKMNVLQELAVSLDYKDWHFFLRRLTRIPHLRSLYIPYIAHHGYSKHLKIGDLVSQIVDLVSIRPEIQLCYLALEDSCFQLIENRTDAQATRSSLYDLDTMDVDDASDVNETEIEENDIEDITDDDVPAVQSSEDPTEDDSNDSEEEAEYPDEDVSEEEQEEPPITIRQILFYDSMVSIFNARHGEIRP